MKDKEKRNKKGSESTIGKIIYGFLLFMPLFAIGSAILVNTFNQQAQTEQEIEYTYKYKTNEVNNVNDLVVGNIYNLKINSPLNSSTYLAFDIVNINSFVLENYTSSTDYDILDLNLNTTTIYIDDSNVSITFGLSNNDFYNDVNLQLDSYRDINIDIDILYSTNMYASTYINNFSISNYNEIVTATMKQKNITDVFYESVEKVTESPLFNWAENSIIYTTTNATCNALSITTPFIPLLLSYWLIISVMYFLYDIALMLIWVLHDRIHALKDSIT